MCFNVTDVMELFYLSWAIFISICTNLLRIKGSQKASTDPLVCLRFLWTLLHQDLGTSLREKSLSSGFIWYVCGPHGMNQIMRSNRSPLFRKTISPWYDSETLCVVIIVLMVLVLLFSACGLWIVRNNAEYRSHLWVPASLLLMCVYVILSISIRLSRRFPRRGDPYR